MKDSITFNASEIATLTGANHFQKPWETLARVWRRYDRASYDSAGIVTEKDRVDALVATHDALRDAVAAATDAPLGDADAVIARAAAAAEGLGLARSDAIAVSERVRKEVFCAHGNREEGAALRGVGGGVEVREDASFKKRNIGALADGTVVEVGGRLDGYTEDGTVVEVKNRVGGLHFRIPEHEVPQVLVYMFVTDSDAALHVERVSLADGSEHSCTHEKRWDEAEWAALRSRLMAAAAYVRELATDAATAAKFAKSRTKNALLKRRLEGAL